MADERGSGALLVLVGVGMLLAAGLVASLLAGVLVVRTRVAAAADLAALAGASTALSGADAACAQAARVAAANGARLDSCRLQGVQLWVEVSAATPRHLRQAAPVPARARARAHAELVVTERSS